MLCTPYFFSSSGKMTRSETEEDCLGHTFKRSCLIKTKYHKFACSNLQCLFDSLESYTLLHYIVHILASTKMIKSEVNILYVLSALVFSEWLWVFCVWQTLKSIWYIHLHHVIAIFNVRQRSGTGWWDCWCLDSWSVTKLATIRLN